LHGEGGFVGVGSCRLPIGEGALSIARFAPHTFGCLEKRAEVARDGGELFRLGVRCLSGGPLTFYATGRDAYLPGALSGRVALQGLSHRLVVEVLELLDVPAPQMRRFLVVVQLDRSPGFYDERVTGSQLGRGGQHGRSASTVGDDGSRVGGDERLGERADPPERRTERLRVERRHEVRCPGSCEGLGREQATDDGGGLYVLVEGVPEPQGQLLAVVWKGRLADRQVLRGARQAAHVGPLEALEQYPASLLRGGRVLRDRGCGYASRVRGASTEPGQRFCELVVPVGHPCVLGVVLGREDQGGAGDA